ncbi:MAG: hypothetical protein NC409_10390 [Clostridium sp.]|nr:hypothetical protein [Clostridium sp.]
MALRAAHRTDEQAPDHDGVAIGKAATGPPVTAAGYDFGYPVRHFP